MKKHFWHVFLLMMFSITTNAQIRRIMTVPATAGQSATSRPNVAGQQTAGRPNAEGQSTYNRNNGFRPLTLGIVPQKGFIRFHHLANGFSIGAHSVRQNIFAASQSARRAPNQPASGNRVMDYSRPVGNRQTLSSVNNSSMVGQYMSSPRVTKNIGGTNVSYTLKANNDIQSWSDDPLIVPKKLAETPLVPSQGSGLDCHTITMTFSAQSKSFMSAQPESQGAMLMPGMIYTFEDISNGNFPHQVLNYNRWPISLFVPVVSQGNSSADIVNPNATTINDAIQSMRKSFGGNPGGGTELFQITRTESLAEQSLAVTAGGSYGAYSGRASYSHADSKYHIYYTIDAIKELFTVNVMPDSTSLYPPGQAPQPGNGFPVMINNVVYGARVLANMDIALETSGDTAGLNFQYNSIGASAFVDLKGAIANKNATVTINGLLVGFPPKFPGTFNTDLDSFLGLLNNFWTACDYVSAKPLQYTLTDLNGNEMGIESITDKTTIQECTPANQVYTLQSANVSFATGDDDKNDNSEFWLSIASGNEHSPHWIGQIYDNHSKFNKQGNDYTLTFPNVAPVKMDEFSNNGGLLAFKLIAHGHSDDWDFASMVVRLNFVSDHGLTKTKTLSFKGFRISDTDGGHDSKLVLFTDGPQDTYKVYDATPN